MLYNIELETILNRGKKIFKIDEIREKLTLVTTFFENVLNPLVSKDVTWEDTDILSSTRYNTFLSNIERDLSFIYESQKKVRSNMLIDWNTIEQIKPEKKIVKFYDDEFNTELAKASEFINVTLAVSQKVSKLGLLKGDPQVNAATSNDRVETYFGKKYGLWIPNEITNEDGIRPAATDTSVIVDNRDTFFEIEAVTLQEAFEDVVYNQEIIIDDIELTVTVKFIFEQPQFINYVTVKPHNFSTGAYYELTDIVLSSGTQQVGVLNESVLMNTEKTITFDPIFDTVTSMYVTFKQNKGYFEKYSIANFDLLGKNYWVDFTGDSLLKDADRADDPILYIQQQMENIEYWILDIFYNDISYDEMPELNTAQGDEGFSIVESRESRRKRAAIGIEDIDVGEHVYTNESEIVTMPIDIPINANIVQLFAQDNEKGEILYYVSFDDGLNWNRINPIGAQEIIENFRVITKKLFINSDLSKTRKEANEAGLDAFVNTASDKLRLRVVLKKEDDEVPEVKEIESIFLGYE